MFYINGRFTARRQTGQERFAQNIILELDKICGKKIFTLVVPKYARHVPKLTNIEIVYYGKIKRDLWEQISFTHFLKKNNGISINLTTTCSAKYPGIVCLHDMFLIEHPELYNGIYGKLSLIWHKYLLKKTIKKSKMLITVSEYSKQRILHYFDYNNEILVLGNGWDHFKETKIDNEILKKINYENKNYYFAVSSITPQKNFKWILEVAKKNPNSNFIIAGDKVGLTNNDDFKCPKNVNFIGYVTDGELKSLMTNCKAYIQPSIYEGFGIPPLEALSCGTRIIVSDCTCFPEIYMDSAIYINPYKYDYNLDELLSQKTGSSIKVLEKYTWSNLAKKLYMELIKYE